MFDFEMIKDLKQFNGFVFVYIGDVIFEVYVRYYLFKQGFIKLNDFYKKLSWIVLVKLQVEILFFLQD